MPEAYSIHVEERPDDTTLIRFTGALDAKSGPELMTAAADAQTAGHHLIVNLGEVSFIASSGIGALMAVNDQFVEGGRGRVRFANLSPAVCTVVEMLNLEGVLAIDETEDEALRQMKAA